MQHAYGRECQSFAENDNQLGEGLKSLKVTKIGRNMKGSISIYKKNAVHVENLHVLTSFSNFSQKLVIGLKGMN